MKTASLPPLRVAPELRESAESVLQQGETLSAFVEESVRLNIDRRQVQRDFIARGLAAGERARQTGDYVSPEQVLAKLRAKREAHKKRRRT